MADERVLEIEWPKLGIKVEAKPLPYNQKYFDAFIKNLPQTTTAQHTLVTGEAMINYMPINAFEYTHLVDKQERISEVPVGSVFWGTLGGVGIKYGPCTEPLYTLPVAQIPEKYIEDLKRAGRAVWEAVFNTKELLIVEFKKKGGQK